MLNTPTSSSRLIATHTRTHTTHTHTHAYIHTYIHTADRSVFLPWKCTSCFDDGFQVFQQERCLPQLISMCYVNCKHFFHYFCNHCVQTGVTTRGATALCKARKQPGPGNHNDTFRTLPNISIPACVSRHNSRLYCRSDFDSKRKRSLSVSLGN